MRLSVLLAAALLATVVAPCRVAAQGNPLEVVETWDGEYEAAYHGFMAAVEEFQIVDREWDRLNQEYGQVRDRDRERSDRLLAEIQQLSAERTRTQSAVRSTRQHWYDTADSFIDALDDYLDILSNEIQGTPLGDSIEDRVDQFARWNNRLKEVEAQLGPRLSLELQPMPDVRARDTDTPEDLEFKASLLENAAEIVDNLVQDVEEIVAALKRRQERDRSHEDFMASNRRFETNIVPVGAGSDDTRVGVADSTDVDLSQTPEQRIESLETFRDEAAERRDQLLERATELREEAARRGR